MFSLVFTHHVFMFHYIKFILSNQPYTAPRYQVYDVTQYHYTRRTETSKICIYKMVY